MQRSSWRSSIGTGSRHTIYLLLAAVGYRYAAPLVSPWVGVVLYLVGWGIVYWMRGTPVGGRFNAYAGAFVGTAVLSLAGFGVVRAAGGLALVSAGGTLEEALLLAPYSLVTTGVLVPLIFAWEWWISTHRSGRIFFTPLVGALVLGVFWTQAEFRTELLGHPWQYALISLVLVILLGTHHMAMPIQERYPRLAGRTRTRGVYAFARAAILFIVLAVLVLGVYRSWQVEAVAAGGGLLRPTLFRFDFSDVVSLESEIQLSRDLVLLYREDQPPTDRLLRRYVLSGYSPRRGFYALDPRQEPSPVPPSSLQDAVRERFTDPTVGSTAAMSEVLQEYYIVNFDPDAFIAVSEPVEAGYRSQTPRSSFNSAYSVRSRRADADSDFLRTVRWPEELPADWHAAYIETPVPEGVAALAREITEGIEGYYDIVRALERHLLEEYYYSLVPGDALDGDQLSHFLFESRKGYCSYFAFSMTLMARSLGIPARVAAGFFIVPEAGMLGFHPIRGEMAHAWVEVFFPGAGWIEFDPTSQTLAPGESLSVDYQTDREQLAELVEEILTMPEGEDPEISGDRPRTPFDDQLRRFGRSLRERWYILVIAIALVWTTAGALRWSRARVRRPDRVAVYRFHLTRTALARSGLDLPRSVPLAATADPLRTAGLMATRARFGPDFSPAQLRLLETECRSVVRIRIRTLVRRGRVFAAAALFLRTAFVPFFPSSVRVLRAPRLFLLVVGILTGLISLHLPPAAQSVPGTTPVSEEIDALETDIRRAIDAENYEQALRRIHSARNRYPAESRFPVLEGDLYYSQELFQPAERAYREALARGASDYSTRYVLARTLARLNRDEEAIVQLERLHASWPQDTLIAGDLAWLYFKRHRLAEARNLLEETIASVGEDRDLLMTLATVYAGLYDYESALDAYHVAIEQAQREEARFFEAVAYYNLSILHANFHRWDAALATTERSLDAAERASGYMIRAELHHRRMNLDRAAEDYTRADLLDRDTPLPGLSLAELYVAAGYPDRAIARMNRVLRRENANWMYSYGTDPQRYMLSVYRVLAAGWESAARRDRLFRPGTVPERLSRLARSLYRRMVAWFYRGMYRRQCLLVARDLERQGRELPAARLRMAAAENAPALAHRHAARAEEIETRFNPETAVDYRLLRARYRDDTETLSSLVGEFSDRWRAIDRADALRELYRIEGDRTDRGRSAAAQLYRYAPGSFLIHGLKIPVQLDLDPTFPLTRRVVARRLGRLGFRVRSNSPLRLELHGDAGNVGYRVVHEGDSGDRSAVLRTGSVRGAGDTVSALDEIAETLTGSPLPDDLDGE